ncbi:MAG: hypothetical protein Q9170_006494 [Blastenia crenularia]
MDYLPSNKGTSSSISIDYESLEFITLGKSGVIYGIDEKRILKEYHGEDSEKEVERRAFHRLGLHPNIVKYLGSTQDNGSIILERGECLRTIIKRQTAVSQIPLEEKLCWLQSAALGIRHMHQNNIIHADIGCHNMILVQGQLNLIDFEGCSIDGEEATSCYEWFSYRDLTRATSEMTDIFAYGCAMYEIITGKPPYHELAASDDRRRLVKQLYIERKFPDVSKLPLSEVIRGCWQGTFDSMDDVLQALEAASVPSTGPVAGSYTGSWLLDLAVKLFGAFWR